MPERQGGGFGQNLMEGGPFQIQATEGYVAPRIQPTGYEGAVGTIGTALTKFMEGMSAGRARKIYQQEMQKAKNIQALNTAYSAIANNPNIAQASKQKFATDLSQMMMGQFLSETKDYSKQAAKGGGNPMLNFLRTSVERVVGPNAKDIPPIDADAVSNMLSEAADEKHSIQYLQKDYMNRAQQALAEAQANLKGGRMTQEIARQALFPIATDASNTLGAAYAKMFDPLIESMPKAAALPTEGTDAARYLQSTRGKTPEEVQEDNANYFAYKAGARPQRVTLDVAGTPTPAMVYVRGTGVYLDPAMKDDISKDPSIKILSWGNVQGQPHYFLGSPNAHGVRYQMVQYPGQAEPQYVLKDGKPIVGRYDQNAFANSLALQSRSFTHAEQMQRDAQINSAIEAEKGRNFQAGQTEYTQGLIGDRYNLGIRAGAWGTKMDPTVEASMGAPPIPVTDPSTGKQVEQPPPKGSPKGTPGTPIFRYPTAAERTAAYESRRQESQADLAIRGAVERAFGFERDPSKLAEKAAEIAPQFGIPGFQFKQQLDGLARAGIVMTREALSGVLIDAARKAKSRFEQPPPVR